MKNCRIIQTIISPKIYVSTAAIWYDWGIGGYGPSKYFQYETWCFSDDINQRSFQIIHGCCGWIDFYLLKSSIKIHRYISNNLKEKYIRNRESKRD